MDILICFRFIQPYRNPRIEKNVPAVPSPLFDQIVPVKHRVCAHSDSCQSFVYKVNFFLLACSYLAIFFIQKVRSRVLIIDTYSLCSFR